LDTTSNQRDILPADEFLQGLKNMMRVEEMHFGRSRTDLGDTGNPITDL
jgi:hypothetical protein